MSAATQNSTSQPEDFDIVEIWLRRDPIRWMAGAFAGIFAAVVMWLATAICAKMNHTDALFLIKVFAVPVIGGKAMTFGMHAGALLVGGLVFGLLSVILGVVYAHMTGTNRVIPLVGMGVTWGCFSWIFLNNLFSPSIREIFVLDIPRGPAFLAWLVFGLSLVSVSLFDRMFRGSKN